MIHSNFPVNAVYQWSRGPEEAILYVDLNEDAAFSVEELKERLRKRVAKEMPELRFSFEPSDIVNEVMSFGSPTPIEIAVSGPSLPENRAFAEKVRDELAQDSLAARHAVRPVAGLSHDRREDRSREGRPGGAHPGRRLARADDGHFVEPLRRAQLLGRSQSRASPIRCRSKFRGPCFASPDDACRRSSRPTTWRGSRSTTQRRGASARPRRRQPASRARCPDSTTATT